MGCKTNIVPDFTKHFVERWNCCREEGNLKQKKLEVNIANVDFFQERIKSNVQVLRSASKWSVGIKENSILQGYYKLIDDAKHYLYIENQFFLFLEHLIKKKKLKVNIFYQM